MCRSKVLLADLALRAVLCIVGSMSSTAGLAAILANNAVVGILRVRLAGCVTAVVTLRAILGRNMCRTGNGDQAVLAGGAIIRHGTVRLNLSNRAANITIRVAKVSVRMRGIGNGLAAVFANGTIGAQRLVAVAFANVVAVFAGNVVLILENVRRCALKSAVLAVANSIAFVGVLVAQSILTFCGLGTGFSANGANLLQNLSIGTGSGRQLLPCVIMGNFSSLSATGTATDSITLDEFMLKRLNVACLGFLRFTFSTNSVLYFIFGTSSLCLGCPIAEEVSNFSGNIATLAVTYLITCVIVKMLYIRSGIAAILIVANRVALKGVLVLTHRIAGSGFFNLAVLTTMILNLGCEAGCRSLGSPLVKIMHSAVNLCAANPADRAICIGSEVAGAISLVCAIVTLKVGFAIVGVRRNALCAAAFNVTISVAVVVVNVLGYASIAATLTVTGGVAIMIVIVTKCCNIADSGFFSFTYRADSVFNFSHDTSSIRLGCPITEGVGDNSYVIAVFAVASGVTGVVIIVAKCCFSGFLVFVVADVAESMKNFSGGTSSRDQRYIFFGVSMLDRSLVVALCAVTSGVAIMIEDMSKRGSTIHGLFNAAESAGSCNHFGLITGRSSLGFPFREVVNVFTNGLTGVAIRIASIVINVIGNNARCAAKITICVTCMIVSVVGSDSKLAANVTICIAGGGVNMVGNHSQFAADVAGGVAIVGVGVRAGNSESAANVTGLVAIVGVNVIGYSFCAAEITVGVAIVGVNVLGSLSFCAAEVTICIAGAIEGAGLELGANEAADLASCIASTLISVLSSFSDLAANIAFGVAAICKCVGLFGLTGDATAFVTRRIARTGVHMVFFTEATCKSKEHQCHGQCEK